MKVTINKQLLYCLDAVDGQQRETEAVKLMSLKAGLLDHSRAWQDVGSKCSIFAQAERVLLDT